MNNNFITNELYVGCECLDLCHVAHFLHFPPFKDDEEVIYYNVQTINHFNRIIPPLRYFYNIDDWKSYFSNCWLRRVGIACKYIFKSQYKRKWGVLDCFDFQEKDLSSIDTFLSLMLSDIATFNVDQTSELWINNDEWLINFNIDRMKFEDRIFPWQLGWNIQFKYRRFFNKIYYAFKYMFRMHSDQQCFEMPKIDAVKMRSMIKWIQKNNKQNDVKNIVG